MLREWCDAKVVGENIRRERVLRHWTQEDLARVIGIVRTRVVTIEKGHQKQLHIRTAARFARALDVDLEWLVTDHEWGT